jgi:hypothetical protein
MDWIISHGSALVERAVSWRIPKLQGAFESGRSKFAGLTKSVKTPDIRKLRALLLAVASVSFGILAYNVCSEEVALEWQKHHFPSTPVWRAGLVAEGWRGFEAGKDLAQRKRFAQVLKSLPSRVESGNHAWEGKSGSDPSWWAIFPADIQDDPLLFCLKCDSAPKSWQPAGVGWTGFDTVMSVAHTQARSYKPGAQIKAKHVFFLDPYEIRY